MRRTACVVMAIALTAMALGVAAGCNGAVRTDDADNGGSVALAAGETLEVVLESNPTTGYSWRAVEIPGCLEQDGESEYDSDALPGMVGAGGEETWRFTAVEPGEGTLVLEYTRPWESDEQAPVQTYELDVTVE